MLCFYLFIYCKYALILNLMPAKCSSKVETRAYLPPCYITFSFDKILRIENASAITVEVWKENRFPFSPDKRLHLLNNDKLCSLTLDFWSGPKHMSCLSALPLACRNSLNCLTILWIVDGEIPKCLVHQKRTKLLDISCQFWTAPPSLWWTVPLEDAPSIPNQYIMNYIVLIN